MLTVLKRAARGILPVAAAALLLSGCGLLSDTSDPVVSVTYTLGSADGAGATATATAHDPESGIISLKLYRVENGREVLLTDSFGGDVLEELPASTSGGAVREATAAATLERGEFELVAVATNGVGREARASKMVNLTTATGEPDTTKPVVNITGVVPKAGAGVGREPLTIRYVATDDTGVTEAALLVSINGGEFALLAIKQVDERFVSSEFHVDGEAFSYGQTLQFQVVVKDAAGNEASVTSELLPVTDSSSGPDPDVQAPRITAYGLSPVTAGQIEPRSDLSLYYLAQDNRGLEILELHHRINGGEFAPLAFRLDVAGQRLAEGAFTINAVGYAYGDEVEFKIVAYDQAGNESEDLVGPVTVASVADSAPVLTLSSISPSQDGFLNRERVTVEFFADDDERVSQVDLYVSVNGGERIRQNSRDINARGYSGSLDADLNSPHFNYNDEIEFILEAEDESGNVTTVTSPAYILADREAPVIEFISPLEAFEGSYASVSFRATDNDEIVTAVLVVDGRLVDPTNPMKANFYQFDWDISAEEYGLHTLTAIVIDASGNVATETVTVSLTEPDD